MKTIIENIQKIIDEVILCGPFRIRLVSNVNSSILNFFSSSAKSKYKKQNINFELWCISLSEIDAQYKHYILNNFDKTYRGKSFASGYYVTDHFGPPLYLFTIENRIVVFGECFEFVVWPYFVKYFLFLYSINQNSLFLKASAISFNDSGTLLIGRGGAGKTFFISELCKKSHASFVSNSHVVINNSTITGIASNMRVREHSISLLGLDKSCVKKALLDGEYLVDPADLFNKIIDKPIPLKNICLLDSCEPGQHYLKALDSIETYNFLEQFALSINVYRLEEDLLDFVQQDLSKFSYIYQTMKNHLKSISSNPDIRCYYIKSDICILDNREKIAKLLS